MCVCVCVCVCVCAAIEKGRKPAPTRLYLCRLLPSPPLLPPYAASLHTALLCTSSMLLFPFSLVPSTHSPLKSTRGRSPLRKGKEGWPLFPFRLPCSLFFPFFPLFSFFFPLLLLCVDVVSFMKRRDAVSLLPFELQPRHSSFFPFLSQSLTLLFLCLICLPVSVCLCLCLSFSLYFL